MVQTLNGYELPATVDQRTDLNDLPIAASVYMRLNEGRTATDTVLNTFDAMRDSNAIVVLYADGKGIEARVIWPDRISLTSDNHLTCHGYCTLRKECRTFRLDRMIGCHPLSTPDDYEGEEEARRVIAEEFDHERWQRSQHTVTITAPDGQPF
jgi:predicted DNA-binding transcriptional regulator YafY